MRTEADARRDPQPGDVFRRNAGDSTSPIINVTVRDISVGRVEYSVDEYIHNFPMSMPGFRQWAATAEVLKVAQPDQQDA